MQHNILLKPQSLYISKESKIVNTMNLIGAIVGIILAIVGGLGLKWMVVDILLKGVATASIFGVVAGGILLYIFGSVFLLLFLAGIGLLLTGLFE